jgi:hypothetical protein
MPRPLLLVALAAGIVGCGGAGPNAPQGPGQTTLTMKVAPDSTTMARSQQKFFTARPVAGAVPTGARYVWAVLGRGTVALAAGDSVRYTAPAADGVDTLTVQVLDAASQPIGAGATPIRIASGAALAVAISPVSPRVEAQTGAGTQRLVVTPTTGTIPTGATYAWRIVGTGPTSGVFSSGTNATTTTVNNTTYVSTTTPTTDTVSVEVRNSAGAVVASATTPVIVFPGLQWSNSGANALWASNNYGNGSYTSPGGGLGRVDINIGNGAEQISCVYQNTFPVRLAAFQQFNVTFYAPRNTRVQPGNQFVQGATPGTTPGALSMPQVTGVSGITMTVTAVLNQSDGTDFITYTFATAGTLAGYAGAMSGTGECIVRYPF